MRRVLLAAAMWLVVALPAQARDTVYYYYTDALHSAVVETDAHGVVLERTYYAPYGQVLNRSLRNGPGYTGHEEDPATGLVYMQQRYYDAESGRFLSTDPVVADPNTGGSFNRYWYAKDNPYRYTDPDGRCPECIGALIGGGLELTVQLFNPEDRAAYAAAGSALVHGHLGAAFGNAGPQLAKIGVSAAAGALGAGIAGKVGEVAGAVSQATTTTAVGKVTVGTLVQISGNSATGAGVNAAAKVSENAISGNPLGQGVSTAAKVGAVSGAVGGSLEVGATPGAQRLANDTGAFVGTSNGHMAAPGVESATAQRLGAASTESISHAAQCVKTKDGGGC